MSADGVKRQILVVDDEPGLRKLLEFELKYLGYETTLAENADAALVLLRQKPFDLVITDIRMPGTMDGIDLVEVYRKENPSQRVIFMTGYAIEEKLTQALKNPLNVCFRKPFNLHELSAAVAESTVAISIAIPIMLKTAFFISCSSVYSFQ